VSSFVAGELSYYQTSSQVTSAISSALSSYDNSSQVDNKIITALLDFYTRAEVDQAIANVDFSGYYTSAQTNQEIADAIAGLVGVYVRWTELQAPIINEINIALLDYDTSSEVDSKISGAGFLDQTTGDARYLVRAPAPESGQTFNLVQEQFTPRIVRNLLLRQPLAGAGILGNFSTLELTCDCYSKSESDSRYLSPTDLGSLDARYFPNNGGPEGNGIFNLIQTQFTPKIAQSDGRYPLLANFNSLGTTVNSLSTRVTDIENNGGIAPTTDLTVNSVTASTFLDTPELRSSAGDLQVQNALVTTAATGPFNSNSTITANGLISANGGLAVAGITTSDSVELTTELRSPIMKARPTDDYLTITGGTQGIYVNTGAVYMGGALVADPGLVTTSSWLQLVGGTLGVQHQCETMQVLGNQPIVTAEVTNTSGTGFARLRLLANGGIGGADLEVASSGGCTLASINQTISFTNVSGGFSSANVIIYPQSNASLPGWMVATYGFTEASDQRVKTNVRAIKNRDMVEIFDNVQPKIYDRSDSEQKDQIGFIAQEVQAAGKLGPL
ncbi:unnamed protein product, partial [Symbiodinium sp. CCMP2456]